MRVCAIKALVFFLLIIANVYGVANASQERKAIVSAVKGLVETRKPEAEWKPAKVGMTLRESDEIRTGDDASAQVLLDDGGSTGKLEIKKNTHIRLNTMTWDEISGEKKTMIDVALGKVKVDVQKLKGNAKFEVNTPTAVLGVRGTSFDVKVWKKKEKK